MIISLENVTNKEISFFINIIIITFVFCKLCHGPCFLESCISQIIK